MEIGGIGRSYPVVDGRLADRARRPVALRSKCCSNAVVARALPPYSVHDDVAALVVLPRLDLWGHVQRGPDAAPEVPRSFGLEGAAEAEVHELQRRLLDRAVLEQQEVLRLEVSVGEALVERFDIEPFPDFSAK